MKRRVRLTAVFIIITLLLGALQSGAAETQIIFTAVNNTLLPLSDATMPAMFYETPYVPYTVFTNSFDIKHSYDDQNNRLLLFNADYVLTFDLNLNFSYDAGRIAYFDSAIHYNSTIYVPAEFTAGQLGLACSTFLSGPIVRIKTLYTMDDNRFIDSVELTMSQYLEQYISQRQGPPSQGENPPFPPLLPPTITQEPSNRPVYLVFSGVPSVSTSEVLSALSLYNIRATFVIDGDSIAKNEELVREIAVEGHSIGLGGNAALTPDFYTNPQTMLSNLRAQNDLLRVILKTETRIVLPSGSASLDVAMSELLALNGYRLWRTTYHPTVGENDNAQAFYRNMVDEIPAPGPPLIIRLNCDDLTADALPEILGWMDQNNFSFHIISPEDTPPPA